MMTGTVFCNVCPTSDELMDRLDRWVSPINILFFVLSGAELDLTILTNPMVLLIGVVYIVARSAGKISGSFLSCRATSCSPAIQKYLGITLLPQAGVALGMAAEAAELSDGHMVRNVVLFSVLVYELVGPTLAKISLTAAGGDHPRGPHERPYHQQAGGAGQRGLISPIISPQVTERSYTTKAAAQLLRCAAAFCLLFISARSHRSQHPRSGWSRKQGCRR